MRKVIRPSVVLGIMMLLLMLSFALASAPTVQAAIGPSTVIYNLYATDGFVNLADGTPLYICGFVGGRQTTPPTPLTFQNSVAAKVNPGGIATLEGGAPGPTAGQSLRRNSRWRAMPSCLDP